MQPPLLPPPPNTADQAVQSRDHENNCILPAQALTQRTVRREGFCSVCVCMWGKEGGRWDGVSVVDFRRLVFKQTAAVVQGRREGRGAIKGKEARSFHTAAGGDRGDPLIPVTSREATDLQTWENMTKTNSLTFSKIKSFCLYG